MRNFIKKYLSGIGIFLVILLVAISLSNISCLNVGKQSAAVFNPDTLPESAEPASGYAWSDTVGWINFGDDGSDPTGRVYVSDDKLYGYAWGENIGWISLTCSNDTDKDCSGGNDYGVTQNDGDGTLTGYAWGENIGWIDFAPDGGGVSVSTSTSGTNTFSGYAWGENIGWISFSDIPGDQGVTTTWVAEEAVVETCSDSIQNQDETATDCGGTICPACGGGGGGYTTCGYEYSDWSACTDGTQTRTVTPGPESGCDNEPETLTQSCIPEIAISITPSATTSIFVGEKIQFSAEVTGTTTNNGVIWLVYPIDPDNYYGTISDDGLYTAPENINTLVSLNLKVIAKAQASTSQMATADIVVNRKPLCTGYTYSDWGNCINEIQTRTASTSIPINCSGGVSATTTRSCTVIKTATTTACTGYTYSDWSPCLNNKQNRTTLTSIPENCVGGEKPINETSCILETPVIDPKKDPITPDNRSTNGGGGNDDSLISILDVSGLLTDNIAVLGTTTEKIILGAKKIAESKTGDVVAKTITTAGIVGGGIAASSVLVLNGTVVADLLFLPFKLWGLLLSILGLKKRNRPWGTIYDSVTKQPIDPAYVTLKKVGSTEETVSITDLDGRYGFLVAPGQYLLTANKTNYIFPSQKMAGQISDVLYNNLYFGETINIMDGGALISKNIPLDPLKFDWNEFVKNQKKMMRFYSKREKMVRIVTDWIFRLGFLVSLLSLFLVTAPYNLIIFGLYILLTLLRKFGLKQRTFGSLTEKDGTPLSFAVVRIMSADLNVEVTNKVADKIGRYYCLVPKGKYYIKIEKKNDDESYSLIHTSPIIDAVDGIINKNLVV